MKGRSSPDITGNNVAYGHKPTVAGPDRTVKKCASLTSLGFVSPGVMVGFAFIFEGMSVTPRSVMVWGGVSQHHRTELVVIAGNLNSVHYTEDFLLPHVVPFLQALPDMPSSMTMPPAILLVLCVISCKTEMSVSCHGQRRARISIPLSTSGTFWIGG